MGYFKLELVNDLVKNWVTKSRPSFSLRRSQGQNTLFINWYASSSTWITNCIKKWFRRTGRLAYESAQRKSTRVKSDFESVYQIGQNFLCTGFLVNRRTKVCSCKKFLVLGYTLKIECHNGTKNCLIFNLNFEFCKLVI